METLFEDHIVYTKILMELLIRNKKLINGTDISIFVTSQHNSNTSWLLQFPYREDMKHNIKDKLLLLQTSDSRVKMKIR